MALNSLSPADWRRLDEVQRAAFAYFPAHTNPENGLTADSSGLDSHASIAATGMALSCLPIALERGFLKRREAQKWALAALRFFQTAHVRGFYFHFLDIKTGLRGGKSELSSLDTALLLLGFLTLGAYFGGEIEERAAELFARADWEWMTAPDGTLRHGWKPGGFLNANWRGYNEALLLYILALGAGAKANYAVWCADYRWKKIYGHEVLYCGPLFTHQFPHLWLDLRDLQDDFMREKASDYFQNTRRMTLVQQEYARRNPRGFAGYDAQNWGFSASEGPGPRHEKGQRFWGYHERGAPYGADDGTLAPWAAVTSLPFAPDEVMALVRAQNDVLHTHNPTLGWKAPFQLGINLAPVVLMIENFRSGLLWELGRKNSVFQAGLEKADFRPIDKSPETLLR